MLMFSNWVDLWPAVTIILPFTPAGWRNQAGQLKPEGKREKANATATGSYQYRWDTMKETADEDNPTWAVEDRRE